MKLRLTKAIAIALTIGASTFCAGCTSVAPTTRIKSPAELFHNMAFGGKSLTTSEYIGSEHAREWDMAKHAEALANQQRQAAMPNAQYR